jgi:hypothetical protein
VISHVITVVSVLLNVLLLVVVFYGWQWKQYRKGLGDEAASRVPRPEFRRYLVVRDEDVSGVSGTGVVCEVAQFSDGHAAVHWLGKWPMTTPHHEGLKTITAVHGHEGRTRLVPIDPV